MKFNCMYAHIKLGLNRPLAPKKEGRGAPAPYWMTLPYIFMFCFKISVIQLDSGAANKGRSPAVGEKIAAAAHRLGDHCWSQTLMFWSVFLKFQI